MVLALELQLILNDPSPHHWDSGDFTITNPLMEKMMTAALESPLKREVLNHDRQARTTELLQKNLVNMIDLALLLKQAHWNVLGQNFRSIHLQLDEIIASVRAASSDEIAERITTLGDCRGWPIQHCRAGKVIWSPIKGFPECFRHGVSGRRMREAND